MAGGTYKWMKIGNRASWARFVCALVWHGQWGGGGAGSSGGTGGGSGVVVVLEIGRAHV